jgi:hypothetical protein
MESTNKIKSVAVLIIFVFLWILSGITSSIILAKREKCELTLLEMTVC